MSLIQSLDRRLHVPGDTELQRTKRRAAWLAGTGGLLLCMVIGVVNLAAGLDIVGILYFELAAIMIVAILALTFAPQHYFALVLAISALVTVHPWLVHVASGGFRSGFVPVSFILFGPVSALLLIGSRPAIFNMALLITCATIAALLEPWAAQNMLIVAPWLRISIAWFNVVTGSLMIFGLTFFIYLEAEQARLQSDVLLLNILPASIAARLKREQGVIAERYDDVTVLFADIVDFTPMSAQSDPTEMVGLLNDIFSDFDDLAGHYGLEKIKTIGDAYMVAGGLPEPRPDHLEAVAAFAVDIVRVVKHHRALNGDLICVRVGINTGPVVAGVIGHRKFIYDLWGDAVNLASRMESQGIENCIQVTQAVRDRLNGRYAFVERGVISVKGKGDMTTYLMVLPDAEQAQ
jgi:class 3 adenylate cyclase